MQTEAFFSTLMKDHEPGLFKKRSISAAMQTPLVQQCMLTNVVCYCIGQDQCSSHCCSSLPRFLLYLLLSHVLLPQLPSSLLILSKKRLKNHVMIFKKPSCLAVNLLILTSWYHRRRGSTVSCHDSEIAMKENLQLLLIISRDAVALGFSLNCYSWSKDRFWLGNLHLPAHLNSPCKLLSISLASIYMWLANEYFLWSISLNKRCCITN